MITLTGINKRHGNQILFVDASLQLNPGEKVGLTGPNGAGKSTVFRLIVGEEKPDDGEVALPRAPVARLLPPGHGRDEGALGDRRSDRRLRQGR
jgi:ATPase subunit of ABC transporter with duplicated ATPase domains